MERRHEWNRAGEELVPYPHFDTPNDVLYSF